jgi:hypothetical protein
MSSKKLLSITMHRCAQALTGVVLRLRVARNSLAPLYVLAPFPISP